MCQPTDDEMLDMLAEYRATKRDIEDDYAEYLMAQPELGIGNGDRLTELMDRRVLWDEFLASRQL